QNIKDLELGGLMMRTYQLRHRMMHVVQNLVYYMMTEVVDPKWHQLMDTLNSTCKDGTMDDLLSEHSQFQDTCMRLCLLTNLQLMQAGEKITLSSM
ncbi:unnamed protein product, partial [Discosporangium mesarthrocarpum]